MADALRSAGRRRRAEMRFARRAALLKGELIMLEKLADLPEGIEGVKAVRTVSRRDYKNVLEPMLDDARRTGRHLRFLYEFGPEFEHLAPSAVFEDAKIGLRSMRLYDSVALVSDVGWLRESVRRSRFLLPCPVRTFSNAERDAAIAWLQELPEDTAVAHRLLPDSGVIVVEVHRALRAQDFDKLALTADTWIASHHQLRGLVIHARAFPGWENLGGLLRHVRFVRDHQRKIERVALVADAKLAHFAPRVAQHLVTAEVRHFDYDDLDAAIAWASSASHTHA
jgi:hypothetical protein